jgi:hypothetical protein
MKRRMANLGPGPLSAGVVLERHEIWAVSFESIHLRGQGATKSEAIAEAERAIDRALAPKKLRLVRREID